MKPAASIGGITHHVSIAPPVSHQSVMFIAASIPIIEIRLMPNAVLNASAIPIPERYNMIVSNMMLVINPLIMARIMMDNVGQGIWVN